MHNVGMAFLTLYVVALVLLMVSIISGLLAWWLS